MTALMIAAHLMQAFEMLDASCIYDCRAVAEAEAAAAGGNPPQVRVCLQYVLTDGGLFMPDTDVPNQYQKASHGCCLHAAAPCSARAAAPVEGRCQHRKHCHLGPGGMTALFSVLAVADAARWLQAPGFRSQQQAV